MKEQRYPCNCNHKNTEGGDRKPQRFISDSKKPSGKRNERWTAPSPRRRLKRARQAGIPRIKCANFSVCAERESVGSGSGEFGRLWYRKQTHRTPTTHRIRQAFSSVFGVRCCSR
ncbi:hypothetical protein BRADI_3g31585v3 [Brachypodium distachyon]|uniref:Uncharacterized protein n=1 Tax=Brachypodium distachyon TaxID=15368 RepID=A0A2K2D0E3_BRADI|nr:hypothetical protein BRADI_3g31585v3 [Brachypodium distachyon]